MVEDLKTQQQSLEAEIAKIQQKKEAERALLINQLNNGEFFFKSAVLIIE